jgi:hypothetical protein
MEDQTVSALIPNAKGDIIAQVHEDMKVYDAAGKLVGHVDGITGGTLGEAPTGAAGVVAVPVPVAISGQQVVPVVEPVVAPGKAPVLDRDDTALDMDDDMPREMRQRLEHNGFIRIDAGFLRRHRFALREQIERVDGDTVVLNVPFDNLIKH